MGLGRQLDQCLESSSVVCESCRSDAEEHVSRLSAAVCCLHECETSRGREPEHRLVKAGREEWVKASDVLQCRVT